MKTIVLASLLVTITRATESDVNFQTTAACVFNEDKTTVNCDNKGLLQIPKLMPRSVQQLSVRRNKILHIKSGDLSSLDRLESIWLDRNLIDSIEPFAFQNLGNVSYLNLGYNHLMHIGPDTFAGMPRLKILVLDKNYIQSIHNTALSEAVSLQNLYVQTNRLSYVPDL